MAQIQVKDLTFGYDDSIENVFENVSFNLDTDWKLGLIGRNGKGKTTFLNLLLGKYKYQGNITGNTEFEYFPYKIDDENDISINILYNLLPNVEDWKIYKELNLLNGNSEILYRSFNTLSGGEKIKILLIGLFLKENKFLLIDEPTNHLDKETKNDVEKYLKSKKGYIIVSHDRNLLDSVVDHIISINKNNIDIQKGNYSSWKTNKDNQDKFEILQNQNLEKSINKLENAISKTENWSKTIEKTKYGDGHVDKGYIGHQSSRMMQRSKAILKRKEAEFDKKSTLLKNLEKQEDLKIKPLKYEKSNLIIANKLQITYDGKAIFQPVNFNVQNGDRIAIIGKNGSGKSSILKLILQNEISYNGEIRASNDLIISYVSQETNNLKGSLKKYIEENNINEPIFKAMLSKLGFSNLDFDKEINRISEGQKKKILIAKSISESAHIYIWDEPLNFVDIISREQIEKAILEYNPTMIFVEHDEMFIEKIATKKLQLF